MGVVAVTSQSIRAEVAELLGAAVDAVDPDGDLIGQGLDSIRMMSLAGRWRKRGIDIDFATLAAEPSVRAWADLLAGSAPGAAEEVEPQREPSAGPNDDEPFGLAPMQHAMWVGREDDQQLGGVAGHLYVEFDIDAAGSGIDPQRLTAAATALAARHPMLRVQFLPDGTQRIAPPTGDFPVVVDDLRDLPDDRIAERMANTQHRKAHQRLDGQVFELTLTVLPGGATRLHVDLDMQAGDAMSYRTLMADLAALYRGAQLPPLDYTYREYRLATTTGGPRAEADRQWWAQRIPELPDPPRLPLVPLAEQADPHHTTRRWHWLEPDVRDGLYAAARRRGITPAMALAGSFSDALACWSAGRRFLLNVPMFGRDQRHPDVDRLVGDFTSSLLLDVDLQHASTATRRGEVLQQAFRSAAAHAEYSGLEVLRDLGRHRGTQVLAPVVYTSALGLGELFAPEVTAAFGTPVWINSQGPQVMLDAQVTEFNGGVLVNWDVREDCFPEGVIDAMFARHIAELQRLAADDTAWEAPTPEPLPPAARAVRDAVNASTAAPSGDALHTGFFASAQARPQATAMISDSQRWTYGELAHDVSSVAAALKVAGIRPGDTVAVLGPKGAEQIIALLAILAAGAVYLPIGVDQPADRAAAILAGGAVRMALYCGDAEPVWTPSLTVTEALRIGGRDASSFVPEQTDPHELAYVLFTSGSTGEPKGVEVTHDAAMNTAEFLYRHFDIGPTDRCLALATPECDLSVLDMFATLATGGAIVVVDEQHRRNPDHWAALIAQHRVTVLNFLPGWLEMLVEVGDERDGHDVGSVRVVLTGGDWVRTAMVRRLQQLAPGVRVAGLGGATETAIHATLYEAPCPPPEVSALPYGVPFANNVCRVVNEAGQDCPDWVPGELWFAGRGIASGYRGQPELTAQRFVRYAGRTWYRSGDLARYRPDGSLEFVGRADHRVKISGYRIELGDVEAALQRIPGVRAAVAGVVGGPSGDVLAALVAAGDSEPTEQQVRDGIAEFVPPHMIPRHLGMVESIPFTVGGKTDRRAAAVALAALAGVAGAERRVPETALERALAVILAELLGTTEIGTDDDFFELGGDSVLATAAVARIRQWLDTATMAVPDIFATRTVRTLAHRLTQRESGSDRLELVAEVYLEIAQMDGDDVLAALESAAS